MAALIVAALGLRLMLGRRPVGRRRVVILVVVPVLALVNAAAFLAPLPDRGTAPQADSAVQYWPLPTGSRLAYQRIAATGRRQGTPIVVLHGGPGIPDMASDVTFVGALAALGYDLYVYDQLGAGQSGRLRDPAGYGIGRDVADLEAIRRVIGGDQMILIAHSYGGSLAAHYLAVHPQRVARMISQLPRRAGPG